MAETKTLKRPKHEAIISVWEAEGAANWLVESYARDGRSRVLLTSSDGAAKTVTQAYKHAVRAATAEHTPTA